MWRTLDALAKEGENAREGKDIFRLGVSKSMVKRERKALEVKTAEVSIKPRGVRNFVHIIIPVIPSWDVVVSHGFAVDT